MKNILFSLIFAIFFTDGMMAQSVPVSFTGRDANNNWVQLERVSVTNQTKGWQETIYWPDTTLTMQNGGTDIDDYADNGGFVLSQNLPNPFNGTTDVLLTVTDAGTMTLEITDVNGRIVVGTNDYSPLPGHHQFRITLSAAGTYVMTARQNGKTSSIKMVNNDGGNGDGIEYAGIVRANDYSPQQPKSDTRGNTNNPFDFGDLMEYVGYATINGEEWESQHILQPQETVENMVLQFSIVQLFRPTVTTATVSDITNNSALAEGEVVWDGGDSVCARGVCWDTLTNPTISCDHTTDGSGIGSFVSTLTNLIPNTTYYVRAYATNSIGTSYGDMISFITENFVPLQDGQPCPGVATLTDVDGNVYNTVQIGWQCWMKENMRTTHYADMTEIPAGSEGSTLVPYRYAPGNNTSHVSEDGYLYNWPAVMRDSPSSIANPSGVQGICPVGWHVPSYAEWMQLTDYVSSQSDFLCGGDSANIAKALASTTGWMYDPYICTIGNTPSSNNATGFSATSAGGYYENAYTGYGGGNCIWSATESDSNKAYYLGLGCDSASVTCYGVLTSHGASVRCLRD